jgi:dihydrofolate reductase
MSRLRVHCFSVSADGYGAGPDQTLDDPLGRGGMELHRWAFATRSFQAMHGTTGGDTGTDDDFIARGNEGLGAWIIGRNMFGPVRGPWPDESWRGWWGEEPPYRCPVFVLTHHARPALRMAGGTVFHFVTEGLDAALILARRAAGGRDVRLGGGVATLRAALAARLVDEMHLAIAPVLLGSGEAVFAGLDLPALGYRVAGQVATAAATHLTIGRA